MTQGTPHVAIQEDLFGPHAERALLDKLIESSKLYRTSSDYKQLLDFVVRLRNFAPFNAMLLQVQKPGLNYAASAADWWLRFGRAPKEGARPLLILWPFGPVALVYDAMDTEGKELPLDVAAFFASGPIDDLRLADFRQRTEKKKILWKDLDAGDLQAGSIKCVRRAAENGERNVYRMFVNKNHVPPVRFATLVHELAHLLLGHLGPDKALNVPVRRLVDHERREVEAESVAYLVCARNDVEVRSQSYLQNFIDQNITVDDLDIYQIMRAAGQVETLLGLTARTRFDDTPGV